MIIDREQHIKERVQKHYDYVTSLGYEVVAVFLQGSQNYNLDIYNAQYMSDVDTKAIVLPTLEDLVRGHKMTSTKYDFEGEQIDVKDIRVMMDMFRKQNQSYIEILFTKYYIVNPKYKKCIDEMIAIRDDITKLNIPQLARCIRGMASEKANALEHPFPATMAKIEDHGFDEKQLASLARLAILMERMFLDDMSFKDSIYFNNVEPLRDYMIDLKMCVDPDTKKKLTVEGARILADIYDTKCHDVKEIVVEKYGKEDFKSEIFTKLEDIVYEAVKQSIISQVDSLRYKQFEDLCNSMTYLPKEVEDAIEASLKEQSIPHQDNFYDYYKED